MKAIDPTMADLISDINAVRPYDMVVLNYKQGRCVPTVFRTEPQRPEDVGAHVDTDGALLHFRV